jgi:hypothetical protein
VCARELGPVFIGSGTMNMDGNGAPFVAINGGRRFLHAEIDVV